MTQLSFKKVEVLAAAQQQIAWVLEQRRLIAKAEWEQNHQDWWLLKLIRLFTRKAVPQMPEPPAGWIDQQAKENWADYGELYGIAQDLEAYCKRPGGADDMMVDRTDASYLHLI